MQWLVWQVFCPQFVYFYLFIYFKNSLRKFLNSFSNDRNSAYFDNIRLKLSKHAYSGCVFTPYCQNMRILKIGFYDVITNEPYSFLFVSLLSVIL